MDILYDEEDNNLVKGYSWCIQRYPNTDIRYAAAWGKGYGRRILMHRLIMNAPQGMVVDHINHNGLDNRRHNLRVVTPTENLGNRRRNKNNTSGYKGIYYEPLRGKWRATIRHNSKIYRLGRFDTATEAARAYDEKAKELYEPGVTLNFPL